MVLCIDVGNTDIVVGVFNNDNFTRTVRFRYVKGLSASEYLPFLKDKFNLNFIDYTKVKGCVLCCVALNTLDGLNLALQTALGVTPFIFKNDGNCNLQVKIGNPDEVGTDILASCLMIKQNNHLPSIVIDMGTATTVTAMDKDGYILGVSIIPGVMTSLWALRDKTGLPIDENLTPPPNVIGTTTPESMASGIVLGSAYCIDGMIEAFESQMKTTAQIFATGGASKFIIPHCKREIEMDDNLLIKGLYEYYKNCIL